MAATAQHASKFTRFMNSETGPKTVHFWAPVMKWCIFFAGISDLQRPVEKVSGTQQVALFSTGVIWTRWAGFVIKPRNPLLASVNFCIGAIAGINLYRLADYRYKAGDSTSEVFSYIINGGNGSSPKETIEAPMEAKQI